MWWDDHVEGFELLGWISASVDLSGCEIAVSDRRDTG